MKKIVFYLFLFVLVLTPFSQAVSQSNFTTEEETIVFDSTGLPQWAKDVRRWDIVAFGTFPFSMLFTTFFHDMYRWNKANSMDFSSEGRRYAPWPFKSAGAVEMTNKEFKRNILMAAGLSATLAFTDLLIVKLRQNKERRRIESKPPSGGTFIIEKRPVETIQAKNESEVPEIQADTDDAVNDDEFDMDDTINADDEFDMDDTINMDGEFDSDSHTSEEDLHFDEPSVE